MRVKKVKRLRKPIGYRPVLQIDTNAKTVKGRKFGVVTGIMYLAPHTLSGVINVCPMATKCIEPCLNTAGRGGFTGNQLARIRKTKFMVEQPEAFLASLRYDIHRLTRIARRLRMKACVRINGTSDLPKLAVLMAREFPRVQFYDYTKIPRPYQRILPNYHITFSFGGDNLPAALDALAHGINVAVVFDTKRGAALPDTWYGRPVIDGDVSDLRFRDAAGVIVGLRAKGKARKDCSGFVQSAQLVQILIAA